MANKISNDLTFNGKATAFRRQRLSLIGFRGDMFSPSIILECAFRNYLVLDKLRQIVIVNDESNLTHQSSVVPIIFCLCTETGDMFGSKINNFFRGRSYVKSLRLQTTPGLEPPNKSTRPASLAEHLETFRIVFALFV